MCKNSSITYDEALATITKRIDELSQEVEEPLVIVDENLIEKPFGWVFFYNSKKFIDSGEAKYMLMGNAPFIFNRFTGEVVVTGTAYPIEKYISLYEKNLLDLNSAPEIKNT